MTARNWNAIYKVQKVGRFKKKTVTANKVPLNSCACRVYHLNLLLYYSYLRHGYYMK